MTMTMPAQKINKRPIIFAAESIRMILAGGKTQTRRVLKPQPLDVITKDSPRSADPTRTHGGRRCWVAKYAENPTRGKMIYCRYGEVGDRFWVRESWRVTSRNGNQFLEYADGMCRAFPIGTREQPEPLGFRTPIFMPRWASRLTLEITGVRIQRLRNINGGDAWAEGARAEGDVGTYYHAAERIEVFIRKWDSINAKRGFPFESNPFVWVIEFKVIATNGHSANPLTVG